MARRPSEKVINTLLSRKDHARMRRIQRELRLATLTDALDVLLNEYEADHSMKEEEEE